MKVHPVVTAAYGAMLEATTVIPHRMGAQWEAVMQYSSAICRDRDGEPFRTVPKVLRFTFLRHLLVTRDRARYQKLLLTGIGVEFLKDPFLVGAHVVFTTPAIAVP